MKQELLLLVIREDATQKKKGNNWDPLRLSSGTHVFLSWVLFVGLDGACHYGKAQSHGIRDSTSQLRDLQQEWPRGCWVPAVLEAAQGPVASAQCQAW